METRGKRDSRPGQRNRDTQDTGADGQYAISRVSDPVASPNVMRLRTRDVPRILPTRPRTPESTPEQEEDELSRLRDREKTLITEMGGATDAFGICCWGRRITSY